MGSDGDVGTSLHSALKIDTYCQNVWVGFLVYLKVPLRSCPEKKSKSVTNLLKVLNQVAVELADEQSYPPSIVIDSNAQI